MGQGQRENHPNAFFSVEPEPQPQIYESPNHGGIRPKTLGVIIHSTRSGRFTPTVEYRKTIEYMMKPGTVSSHRVIGVLPGQDAQLVPDHLQAWHGEELNMFYLSIELAQPKPTDPFTPWQYEMAAAVIRGWARQYRFPLDRAAILGHSETAQGQRWSKSDPGKMFDWDKLIGLLAGG